MHLNTTPDPKEKVHIGELRQLNRAFWQAYRPGICARTLLAAIVAAGSVQGIDYTQEERYARPVLLARTATAFTQPTAEHLQLA